MAKPKRGAEAKVGESALKTQAEGAPGRRNSIMGESTDPSIGRGQGGKSRKSGGSDMRDYERPRPGGGRWRFSYGGVSVAITSRRRARRQVTVARGGVGVALPRKRGVGVVPFLRRGVDIASVGGKKTGVSWRQATVTYGGVGMPLSWKKAWAWSPPRVEALMRLSPGGASRKRVLVGGGFHFEASSWTCEQTARRGRRRFL